MVIKMRNGYSLVELIVVIAVFSAVIMIAGSSFNAILTHANKLTRSEESNFEGMAGLEIMRHDLAQAGFGLFYEYDLGVAPPSFTEAVSAPANILNTDVVAGKIPLAVSAINNLVGGSDSPYTMVDNSDYLSIRATSVSNERNSQRWTFLQYTSVPKRWVSNADNIDSNSWVVLVRRAFTASGYANRLVMDPGVSSNQPEYFATQYPGNVRFSNAAFEPKNPSEILYVYGLGVVGNKPRMPFNRADYFVAAGSNVPRSCADNTGVLYKGLINHADGKINYSSPILDCVADMQVVFGWDLYSGAVPGQDGLIDTYSSPLSADGSTISVSGSASTSEVKTALTDAQSMRNSLKIVKIFVLAQDGKFDRTYQSPTPIRVGDENEVSITRTYNLTGNMLNFRWKVYKLVGRPKNIVAAQ